MVLLRPLAYLWALPNTLLGVILLPLVLIGGGRIRIFAGVIEAHGPLLARFLRGYLPLSRGAAAMTLGHVVLGRYRSSLERTRAHERVHVRQCEIWGPFFLPAYLVAGLLAFVLGRDPYRGNYFEAEAFREAAVPGRSEAWRSKKRRSEG